MFYHAVQQLLLTLNRNRPYVLEIDVHDLADRIHYNTQGNGINVEHNNTCLVGVFHLRLAHAQTDVHHRKDLSPEVYDSLNEGWDQRKGVMA